MHSKSKSAFVPVIKVICAHGIRGAMRVFCFDEFDKEEQLFSESHEVVNIISFQEKNSNQAVILLDVINDRNCAERNKGKLFYQYIQLQNDEFLINDLIGKQVIVNDLGTAYIKEIRNYGAGDLLELNYEDQVVLIPFLKKFFKNHASDSSIFSIEKDIFLSFID